MKPKDSLAGKDRMAAPSTLQVFHNLATVDGLPNMFTFQLRPTQVAYANTLRRMILTGVESVAFRSDMNDKGATTDVIITENTTPMTNEMLADRIGLLPVHVEDPSKWNPEEYIFRLNVVNEGSDSKPVLASDFEVLRKGRPEDDPTPVPNTQFFRPDSVSKETCLIAVLKGRQSNQNPQRISLTARATVGIGREHIRFCPVSQCSYAYTIDPDAGRQQQFFERWLVNNKKVDPKSLDQDAPRKEALEREFQTMEVQRCYLVNEKSDPYSFDFMIETLGIQSIHDIIARAIRNITSKLQVYASLDSGNLPENVSVQPADARMKGFDFIIQKEDHTLGNLLQTWMEENLMDSKEITFVGYKVPHPLRDEMVLRVGVEDGKETSARVAVAKAARALVAMFQAWNADWTRFIGSGAGRRSLASLRLTASNAKAMEEASEKLKTVAPVTTTTTTQPRSAFYGKKQATATGAKK